MKLFKKYQKIIGADALFKRSSKHAEYIGSVAATILKNKIEEGKPLMITRFGANELSCVLNYYFINKNFVTVLYNLLKGYPYAIKVKKGVIEKMRDDAGFFSATETSLEIYTKMTLDELKYIDVLGSWLHQEKFLFHLFPKTHVKVMLRDLSPVTTPNMPWTLALKGKRVLVIHPFEESIKLQYSKRHLLFENPDILPEFDLITMKAVQSIAGNGHKEGYKDWFDALKYMKDKIDKINFDIAVLGCGAYGMPLAAHIKKIGKQAVHIGGETQILFGIKGKRWEQPSYDYQNKFYNEHWIRPLLVDIPENAEQVEGGCYW